MVESLPTCSKFFRFLERSGAVNTHIILESPLHRDRLHRRDYKKAFKLTEKAQKNFEIVIIPHIQQCQGLSILTSFGVEPPSQLLPLRGPLIELRELSMKFRAVEFSLLAEPQNECRLERLSIETVSLPSFFFNHVDTSSIVDIKFRFWWNCPAGLDFIGRCPQLQSLHLWIHRIEAEGVNPISTAVNTPKLQNLVIIGLGPTHFVLVWNAPDLDILEVHAQLGQSYFPATFLSLILKTLYFKSRIHHTFIEV